MKANKAVHFVTSGMLASTLIFSFGSGAAFANGDGAETNESAVTSDLSMDRSTTSSSVEADSTTEQTEDSTIENPEAAEQEAVEAPSLIPGDFFYFVKLMSEKIRLAFTFDDYEEAKLLSEFAAERIAEANALFEQGKTDEAADLLKKAIATQEEAGETLPDAESNTGDTENQTQVQGKLAHNIDSLLGALEQVKNPTAQQAIMKNIQKTFTKLDKKFARLEDRDTKLANKIEKIKQEMSSQDTSDTDGQALKNKNVINQEAVSEGDDSVQDSIKETTESKQEGKVPAAAKDKRNKPTVKTQENQQVDAAKAAQTKQAAPQAKPAALQNQKAASQKQQPAAVNSEEKKQAGIKKAEQKQEDETTQMGNGAQNGKGNGNH